MPFSQSRSDVTFFWEGSPVYQYADNFVFLLTIAPLPICWLHLCIYLGLRYSPCSALSSDSPLLPCHAYIHSCAYLRRYLASRSVLNNPELLTTSWMSSYTYLQIQQCECLFYFVFISHLISKGVSEDSNY